MIEIRYDIPALMGMFFGQNAAKAAMIYPLATTGIVMGDVEQYLLRPQGYTPQVPENHTDITTEKSYLGTPVFFPITFCSGEYNHYNKGKIEKKKVDDFRLPLASMASFHRQKRMTETPVGGGNGAVTETYAIENWRIDIQGLCLDEPQHPQQANTFLLQQQRILEFEELVDAIKVKGDLFTNKSIYSIKINSIQFMPHKGRPRVLGYQLQCSSIEPIELIIK